MSISENVVINLPHSHVITSINIIVILLGGFHKYIFLLSILLSKVSVAYRLKHLLLTKGSWVQTRRSALGTLGIVSENVFLGLTQAM